MAILELREMRAWRVSQFQSLQLIEHKRQLDTSLPLFSAPEKPGPNAHERPTLAQANVQVKHKPALHADLGIGGVTGDLMGSSTTDGDTHTRAARRAYSR